MTARRSPAPSSGSMRRRIPSSTACCTTRCSCATGTRGATAGARSSSSLTLERSGTASGTPVNLTAGLDGDVPSKPFGGREDYAISPDGQHVAFSIRAVPVGRALVDEFRHLPRPCRGRHAAQFDRRQSRLGRSAGFLTDGATLAYLAMDRPGFESDRFHLVLLDLAERCEAAAHPELGPLDRELRLVARRQKPVRDHRSPRPAPSVGHRRSHRQSFRDHRRWPCRGFSVGPQRDDLRAQRSRPSR